MGSDTDMLEIDGFTPEECTYQLVKERFEKECLKVRDPFVYLRLEKPEEGSICHPSQLKHTDLRQFYSHLFYYKFEKKDTLT